jgi:hypothetical protein
MTNNMMTLDRLQTLLDTHGAKVARWPESDQRALEALLAASAEARAMVAEAAALDRVLDAAPAGRTSRLVTLTDRIVAEARAGAVAAIPRKALPPPVSKRPRWPAVAAMAASLLIGVYGGFNGWAPQALQQVAGLSAEQGTTIAAEDDSQDGDIL